MWPSFGWEVVTSHHSAVVPQSGAKDQFYCTVYYITLNSNCAAQRVPKILKKWEKTEFESKINPLGIWV